MKKVFIIASLVCIVFSACSNNPNNTTDTPAATEQESVSADSSSMNYTDSTKVAADKMAKDSADAAHGHAH